MTLPPNAPTYVRVALHAARGDRAALLGALAALGREADAVVRTLGTHRLIRFLLVTVRSEDLPGDVAPSSRGSWKSGERGRGRLDRL